MFARLILASSIEPFARTTAATPTIAQSIERRRNLRYDHWASSDFRRYLAPVLTEQAVNEALSRTG